MGALLTAREIAAFNRQWAAYEARTRKPRVIGKRLDGRVVLEISGSAEMWRKPARPMWIGPGTPVTAASQTSLLAGGTAGGELPALDPIDAPGTKVYIEALGEITSTSATPTATFDIRIGTVGQAFSGKIDIANSAAMAISASATAWPWHIRYLGE